MNKCETCGHGDGAAVVASYVDGGLVSQRGLAKDALPSAPARVARLLYRALAAESKPMTLEWLARARLAGASDLLLDELVKAEPLVSTVDGLRHFHLGCRPADVGQCLACGCWSEDRAEVAGQGCDGCAAGATPSGAPESAPMSPEELAQIERQITGRPAIMVAHDKRAERIAKMQSLLAAEQAKLAQVKERHNG